METSGFLLLSLYAVCLLGSALASADEEYSIETTQKEDEDILMVTNKDGELVAEVDVHPADEYQLIKPTAADDHVCLVLRLSTEEGEQTECYERAPFPKEEEEAIDLEECEDREIFLLRPKGCFSLVKRDDGVATIQKRHLRGCSIKVEVRCVCRQQERYCAKYGWWFGRHKCKYWGTRCVRYGTDIIKTISC